MLIRDMFEKDINRPINGVVQVEQDEEDVIFQEVDEYVVTKELKKHFMTFFNSYSDAFTTPTADIGVWISGFFGSGKSHLQKIFSYLLENRPIKGVPTVEYFRNKFSEDPGTFMMIEQAAKHETETILFNIDVEGPANKDKTAVLRVFAKMFYNHLGYCGENLKVAMLEKYIDEQGKLEEFCRVFREKKGQSWQDQRKAFAFNGKFIIPTLMEVLDMSEEDARSWYSDKDSEEAFSIADLARDIKAYTDKKPRDFRLLFMADEVGQYVGTDTDMLLNLQSLTEKIGSECQGKVWIVCTGQEAIDEIIRVRADEFSRIQARFKTRLSLSSSSVDEVIQKRILKKTPVAEKRLEDIYQVNDAALRNLFAFTDSIKDIQGYSGPGEFSENFPFVPYQFTIMQKAFAEIRKHGNAGKHLSGGERSMLSGFQEAAQSVQERDEHALVPFSRFYDTMHSFLDSSIRRVIERCAKAADTGAGLKPEDVDILKLLYLIRYVDDIPANLDNIVILMADDIRTDKLALKEKVSASLDRLLDQNYIGRSGQVYNFLTDEEQDVAREIRDTQVDTAAVVERLGHMIFGDIYTAKKVHYGIYDFPFSQMVDGTSIGTGTGDMCLRFLSAAADDAEKDPFHLMTASKGRVIAVLPDSPYFDSLEKAMKIRKYVKHLNVSQLSDSVQAIIRRQQAEADNYEKAAQSELVDAIKDSAFYADGERLDLRGGDAVSRIDQALEYLAVHVYSKLDLIGDNAQSDEDIRDILLGGKPVVAGADPNGGAAAEIAEYLEMQHMKNLSTSMFDVQSRYQAIPYGWREIDIAAVMARLIMDQRVTIKYSGTTIQPNDPKLPDMLRKKSEIGHTSVSQREIVPKAKIQAARELLREYFDVMDVPSDEDGLIAFIIDKFTEQKDHYAELDKRYAGHSHYPDRPVVQQGIALLDDVLDHQKDNIALIDHLLKREDDLFDSKEKMQRVESFFQTQAPVFDAAVRLEKELQYDLGYLAQEPEANDALGQIRVICSIGTGTPVNYKRIPELNALMDTVRAGHDRLLSDKREEVSEILRQCLEAIHTAAGNDEAARDTSRAADDFYTEKKKQIAGCESLALLDGFIPPMLQKKDDAVEKIEALKNPPAPKPDPAPGPKKVYKSLNRSVVFPARRLETPEDVADYVEDMRKTLEQCLQGCDGIELK